MLATLPPAPPLFFIPPLLPQSCPLTRYFLVRGGGKSDADFNLRLHVETSGYQIEACPDVEIDATTGQGYLTKIGATFNFCHRRWFVINQKRRSLTYYSDKIEQKRQFSVHSRDLSRSPIDLKRHSPQSSMAAPVSTSSRRRWRRHGDCRHMDGGGEQNVDDDGGGRADPSGGNR